MAKPSKGIAAKNKSKHQISAHLIVPKSLKEFGRQSGKLIYETDLVYP